MPFCKAPNKDIGPSQKSILLWTIKSLSKRILQSQKTTTVRWLHSVRLLTIQYMIHEPLKSWCLHIDIIPTAKWKLLKSITPTAYPDSLLANHFHKCSQSVQLSEALVYICSRSLCAHHQPLEKILLPLRAFGALRVEYH